MALLTGSRGLDRAQVITVETKINTFRFSKWTTSSFSAVGPKSERLLGSMQSAFSKPCVLLAGLGVAPLPVSSLTPGRRPLCCLTAHPHRVVGALPPATRPLLRPAGRWAPYLLQACSRALSPVCGPVTVTATADMVGHGRGHYWTLTFMR